MKRKSALVLAVLFIVLSFTACGGKGNTSNGATGENGNDMSKSQQVTAAGIYINEFSTNSTQTLMDDDGDFVSWVEIYNSNSKAVNLQGFGLTDDPIDRGKWIFPNITIEAGQYIVVYLSGKEDKPYDGGRTVHASFKLNGNEQELHLYSGSGQIIDKCKVYDLFSNLSCGRTVQDNSKFGFFARPTPGRENAKEAFDSVDSARYTGNKEIAITEVAAVNMSVTNSDDEYCDFVELYNSSSYKVNLANYKLSDSKDAGSFIRLPEKILAPGEYAVIYCGDDTYVDSYSGEIFVSFGLNRYGETVYLLDKYNVVVDTLTYSRIQNGYSSGKDIDGNGDVNYYSSLTPGSQNPAEAYAPSLPNPQFSFTSTYVQAGTPVEIIAPKGEIHFTIDGSEPTERSPVYTQPISIKRSGVIRARAFSEGFVPSDTVCATYLVTDHKHDLPVVFLTTDEDNLYDYNTGIWADGPGITTEFPYEGANYWQNWERPVNFEYMTPDGVSQVRFDAGISVFGQFSRANLQKSVEIKLKDKYGQSQICYPFFKDNDVNVFSSLVLRNGGQDFNIAHIRDAFAAKAIQGQMDIDLMDYQPVVCYVNGKYHGIYDLREKIDEDYFANHHGVDPQKVDFIKANSDVKNGTFDNYESLLNYVSTYDMSNDVYYNKVCQYVDVDELINYWMCESFFTNTDTGNIKFWRENSAGQKWRWVFFDVDWSLFGSTYDYNIIDNYLDPEGHGVGQNFSTTLTRNLYKNASFRQKMLETFSKHYKTTFKPERLIKILDTLTAEIDSEMPYHCNRWDDMCSYEAWKSGVEYLKEIIAAKYELFPSQMIEGLSMTKAEIEKYLGDVDISTQTVA
ncbi:MAG: CotH kinase family protein [Acutalibacteraceae bacterium]